MTLVRESFTARQLRRLRELVASAARLVGLDSDRGQRLALAVNEAASNAVEHGGGTGELELIRDDNRALIAQVTDHGPGTPAPVPTSPPPPGQVRGRGMYLMHEACDHVECRTSPSGTIIHLEMKLSPRPGPPEHAG